MTRTRERFIAAAIVAAIAAFAGALIVINRREAEKIGKGVYIPKTATITPEIELLQQYVRIDTTNPPGNELPGAKFLAARLDAAGVPYEIIESAPRRANLYARIKGKRPG